MLHKVEGIVLRQVKYSDSSRIIIFYSKEDGKLALFLNGVGKSKKSRSNYIVQPLTIVEVVFNRKAKGKAMGIIKESKILEAGHSTRQNMHKTGIAMFMAEVLHKSIGEEEQNPELYDFIKYSISCLEQLEANLGSFPALFMIKLSTFLGFQPDVSNWKKGCYFDLMEGEFLDKEPLHKHVMDESLSQAFHLCMKSRYGDKLHLGNQQKGFLLDKLMEFYALHLPNFGNLKSHLVLKEVLA